MCWFQQLTPRADTVSLKNTFVYKSQELFPRLRTDAKLFGPLLRFRTLLGDCQRPWRLFGMRTNEWEYIAAVKISENPGLGRKRFGFHLCFLTWNMGTHYIYCLPYRVIVNIQQENKCKSMPKKKKLKLHKITVIFGTQNTTMREAYLLTPTIRCQPFSVYNLPLSQSMSTYTAAYFLFLKHLWGGYIFFPGTWELG